MPDNSLDIERVQTNTRSAGAFRLTISEDPPPQGREETVVTGAMSIFGEQRTISVQILEPLARLSDLVPLARAIGDVVVRETIDHSERLGKKVVCGKKCATCCRYLVPVSIPEAICIHDEIQALPSEQGQTFWDESLSAARQVLGEGACSMPQDGATLNDVGQWYSDKKVACPFLKNDLCAMYSQRPLACREHLVTTPASLCHPETVGAVEKPESSLSILEVLGQVVAELEGRPVEAIMLPLILPWVEENQARIHREWPAREMARCFVDALGSQSRIQDA